MDHTNPASCPNITPAEIWSCHRHKYFTGIYGRRSCGATLWLIWSLIWLIWLETHNVGQSTRCYKVHFNATFSAVKQTKCKSFSSSFNLCKWFITNLGTWAHRLFVLLYIPHFLLITYSRCNICTSTCRDNSSTLSQTNSHMVLIKPRLNTIWTGCLHPDDG